MTDAFKERLEDVLAAADSALATEQTSVPPHHGVDNSLEVRRLAELRPVPPQPSALPGMPTHRRPVYDPFTARRRQSPEWLVTYTTTVVVGDVLSAVTAAAAILPFTGRLSPPVFGVASYFSLLILGRYFDFLLLSPPGSSYTLTNVIIPCYDLLLDRKES